MWVKSVKCAMSESFTAEHKGRSTWLVAIWLVGELTSYLAYICQNTANLKYIHAVAKYMLQTNVYQNGHIYQISDRNTWGMYVHM